ncbi:hypothetical protein V5O48_008543 [Marasmius crinis-equi]|uniref:F-box domain-containing protein n=1 Tax=Marasmius crinis-equi TaxID=585013 RepID=A0ABR3FDN9_9AGAR
MDRRRLHQLEPTDDPFARITIASIRLMRQMDSYNAILAESLKEIVLSSRRWKALKVPNHYGGSPATNWPSPDWQILLGVFADLTQDDLPIFDTLWTHNPLTNPDQPERLTPFASLLPKLSSLRTLAIIDEPMETRIIDPPALPWAFLTTLHLTYSPLMPTSHSNLDSLGLRIHRVAQLCPSLAVLRLAITLSNPPIVGAEEFNIGDRAIMPIEFSRLRSLSLSLDGYGEDLPCRVLYNVLQRMTTPAMENLEINFADRFLPYPYHAETTILPSIDLFSTTTSLLIRRSGCHITRLTIPSPLLTPEPVPLAQYLELLPDLNFLTMSHMHLPLLELLARELSLCPKLEGLKVSQMVEEPDAIIEFAAARRDTLKNLRGCFDEEGGLKVVANRNRFPLTEVVVLEPPFPLSASSL